jgi:dTDP-4-dehydrorhamnose 3,5-epimerase-like enzyme
MEINLIDLDKKSDERGYLFEIISSQREFSPLKFGLIYYNVVNPGYIKGNHYHNRKTEWYCVVKGAALVKLFDRNTRLQKEVSLNAAKPQLLKINPGLVHNITNVGSDEMHFIGYIDEPYDKNDPDTFFEELQ